MSEIVGTPNGINATTVVYAPDFVTENGRRLSESAASCPACTCGGGTRFVGTGQASPSGNPAADKVWIAEGLAVRGNDDSYRQSVTTINSGSGWSNLPAYSYWHDYSHHVEPHDGVRFVNSDSNGPRACGPMLVSGVRASTSRAFSYTMPYHARSVHHTAPAHAQHSPRAARQRTAPRAGCGRCTASLFIAPGVSGRAYVYQNDNLTYTRRTAKLRPPPRARAANGVRDIHTGHPPHQ